MNPDSGLNLVQFPLLFKGLLHLPSNSPEMQEFGFAMAPGNEIFVEVDPRMLTAEPGISKVEHSKRACFLQDEKSLAFFQHYSYMNCFRECFANHTQKVSYERKKSSN